ncbi:hypothetical protein F2P81_010410 [Scophthalmus maximus]|uniref:Mitotic interactor and substrate of PLK1 n=1 Tax=Scophthalmus maximus TaxID=52904 RepID=A0A6A4SQS5_SCOMX|nr:hypothetical protein F2P81_010410 [Scophthalmus maximus]
MATKPVEAWQGQGPVNSRDKQLNESRAQGEVGSTVSHNYPLQDKKAPRAEPEEDIDVLESGAQDQNLQESQTLSRTETGNASKLENQESTSETLEVATEQMLQAVQAQEGSEKPVDECGDAFPPPPPPLIALPTDECFETEGFSSLACDVSEWISDAEIISGPAEELMSADKEWAQTTQITELVHQEVDSISEEMAEDHMTAEENDTELHILPDGFDNRGPVNNTSGAAHHSSSHSKKSDDICALRSPPYADESDEEEEVSMDVTSCQQEWGTLDIRGTPLQPSYSANVSVSTEQNTSLTSPLPAVLSAKQQEELLPKSKCGLTPKRANQEAAQQVQRQGSPPLSTVAMELSNQGGAASLGFGCVEAVRERHSRAGERTEGEREQTGEEEGRKESGLERSKAEGQHGRGLLRYSKTEEYSCGVYFQHRKDHRMESDSCDDSQSDSGVSADFSPCSTLEGNTTISTGTRATAPKETPIEREIRRTIEREHSLRRSRGLPNPPTSPEYVEIPLRKTVLHQSLTTNSEKCQGKDRQFAGKKMQHEIHEEAQREQDLVKLGKVPGFYDKGTVRQLKERKQLFEAFQQPSDSTLTVSTRSNPTSWSSASDISTLENQEDTLSQTSTIGGLYVGRRGSVDMLNPTENSIEAKGGDKTSSKQEIGFSKGTSRQVIIVDKNLSGPAQKLYHAKHEIEPVTTVDSGSPNISSSGTGEDGGINRRLQDKDEEEEEAPKDNPFFKLRSSTNVVKVEQDIREAQERERDLHKQRISLYGGRGVAKGGEGGSEAGERPATIEEKIPTMSPSSLNGLAVLDIPDSSPRWRTGPSAAHQSAGKLNIWPPAQAEEEMTTQQEFLRIPRTPRQKNPLVQRWESGLVNGHSEEDD